MRLRIKTLGMGLLGATAALVLGANSASAITIDFGVATIGGTISYTGAPLQDASSITFSDTSFEVSRTGMNDQSGLTPGDAISITPTTVVFSGDVLTTPITKSWTDSLGTFDETLTAVSDIDRSAPNALTMVLSGTLTGPGITGSQAAYLEYSATQVAGPGGAVSLSLTDSSATPAIPEPSTWAMMMLGFAGLGFAGYRSSRRGGAFGG